MFGLAKKSKAVVGLDIGSSAVKAVELKPAGKGFRVAAFAIEPVPPDSIVDGAIIDGGAVADAIRRVFERKTFKTKEVAASLSGNAVIVKKISLPVMTEAELGESIYWEAEQYIPFDIQDVNLDYQILDPGTGPDSKGTMDVLLVAAKKEKIADYTNVISQAGRVPVVVDVDAFALQNAYEANYGPQPGAIVVLLNAGASAININILNGDQSLFTRDISIGGNAYTEAVQKELGLPFERAEQAKRPPETVAFDEVRGPPCDDRERPPRDPEDLRLLQGNRGIRPDRPDPAERRGVRRRRLRAGARRALQGAGGDVRSVQEDRLRRAEARRRAGGAVGADRGGGGRSRAPEGRRPMIRINLLTVERKVAKKKVVTFQSAQKLTPGCTVILSRPARHRLAVLVAAEAVGAARHRHFLRPAGNAAAALDHHAGPALEQRKAQLQRQSRSSSNCAATRPVRCTCSIRSAGRCRRCCVTNLKQGATPAEVIVDGRCTTMTGLSDFVANLEGSGFFKRGVEIIQSQTETDRPRSAS